MNRSNLNIGAGVSYMVSTGDRTTATGLISTAEAIYGRVKKINRVTADVLNEYDEIVRVRISALTNEPENIVSEILESQP